MSRKTYTEETHGSQKDLQILANQHQDILNHELSKILNKTIKLEWLSPLKDDDYAEYVDQDFINRLDINSRIIKPLNDFWPNGGANWDGLAKDNETFFLIEAKSHISEQMIESTGATSIESINLIKKSLEETKAFLDVKSDVSWCKENYYQYANRIAHLYYLREINKIDAHLLFIYFLNDKTVTGKSETKEDWKQAINDVYKKLELEKNNKLSDFIHNIFIDTNLLKN